MKGFLKKCDCYWVGGRPKTYIMNMCIYTEHIWNMISQHIDLKSKNKSLRRPHGCWVGNRVGFAGVGPKKKKLLVVFTLFEGGQWAHEQKEVQEMPGSSATAKPRSSYDASQLPAGFFLRFSQENTKTMGKMRHEGCRICCCSPAVFFRKRSVFGGDTVRQIWQYMLL